MNPRENSGICSPSEETGGRGVDLLSRDEGSNEGDESDSRELEHVD